MAQLLLAAVRSAAERLGEEQALASVAAAASTASVLSHCRTLTSINLPQAHGSVKLGSRPRLLTAARIWSVASSLVRRLYAAWRRWPWRARYGADSQSAERAHRLEAALAERQAARESFRRRWGGYACHMPNEPYYDWLAPARKRSQ